MKLAGAQEVRHPRVARPIPDRRLAMFLDPRAEPQSPEQVAIDFHPEQRAKQRMTFRLVRVKFHGGPQCVQRGAHQGVGHRRVRPVRGEAAKMKESMKLGRSKPVERVAGTRRVGGRPPEQFRRRPKPGSIPGLIRGVELRDPGRSERIHLALRAD